MDINEQCLEVFREPIADKYQNFKKLMFGQNLSILVFPDVNISVNEILG